MSYHQVSISALSHPQLLKLLRGERIRVKHGHGRNIHVSEEQHKKIMAAHKKGCGTTIAFDPYQIDMHKGHAGHHAAHHAAHHMHGEGVFDIIRDVGKAVAPVLIDAGASGLKSGIAGLGMKRHRRKSHTVGAPKRKTATTRKGKGFMDMIKAGTKMVAPVLIDAGANGLKGAVAGLGIKHHRKSKTTTKSAPKHRRHRKGGALLPAGY